MIANDQQKQLIFFLVAFIAVMADACSLKLQKFDIETPAQILSIVDSPPVLDGRPRFRQIFCGLLEKMPEAFSEPQNCDAFIWRLADEKINEGSGVTLPHHDSSLKIFIVPGAFSDCFPKLGVPFQITISWPKLIRATTGS